MKKLVLALLVVSFYSMISAQNEVTEGVITFRQTMSSSNAQINAQLAMLGDMITTTYFKDDKSRTELSNPMTGDAVTIFDSESGQMMVHMNSPMLGKIYTLDPIPGTEKLPEGVKINKGELERDILGYRCQQYTVELNQDGVSVQLEMYVTPLIKALNKDTFEYLGDFDGGFPLYIKMDSKTQGFDMTMTQEAATVTPQAVEDSKFDLTAPEGYQKVDTIPGM